MALLSRTILFSLVLLGAACASAGSTAGDRSRSNPDIITETELARVGSVPVRQAIEQLRPRFLRSRGASSINLPEADRIVVYLGGTRMGGLEYLDRVTASQVREIQYLSGSDATQRFGTGHGGGAIILISR